MRTVRTLLLATLSTSALAAMPAFAQDGASAVGEIVVTARRQNERLIDVPASVTVLTADMIAKTGVQTAQSFVQLTPGVTIVTGTAEAGDTQNDARRAR